MLVSSLICISPSEIGVGIGLSPPVRAACPACVSGCSLTPG
ncbi:hypothetical protein P9A51_gp65 [Xanthomonas phage Xp12]|uniref:Uncharacterized protein n=1 Tax=Xanthomonas phage Xp12 TaxID=2746072 RepID=A0A7G9UT65_9CAUD|nr:hypothetical protein P9A51_gp65 [Xanthomonas phage Xp12]QNN97220.1 hypothetical protein [Xanthomonas phage Xp12]